MFSQGSFITKWQCCSTLIFEKNGEGTQNKILSNLAKGKKITS